MKPEKNSRQFIASARLDTSCGVARRTSGSFLASNKFLISSPGLLMRNLLAPIQGLRSAELGVRAIESIYPTVTEHSALVANNYHSYRPFNHHASLGLCLICHRVPLPFYHYNIQLTLQLKLNYLLFVS